MMNVAVLIEVLKEQIANPARACVNSESAFVKDKLNKRGETELATAYWNWVCMYQRDLPVFGEEVLALQRQLTAIDKQQTMPSWGTYGT